jgi:hypothetical protein
VQVPLAPQKARSVCGFTHVPPQFTRPDWQESWHDPALQISPEPQTAPADAPVHVPLAPQWSRSVWASMHSLPHWVSPALQATVAQTPAVQTCAEPQAVPANAPVHVPLAPQWVWSV